MSLTKKFAKHDIRFDYATSPTIYRDLENGEVDIDDQNYRQWWSTTRKGLFDEPQYDTVYKSIKYIHELCCKENYDGILGYSQGSTLVQIMLYLQEYPEFFGDKYKNITFNFKFAVTSCTFNITDNVFKNLYDYKLTMPVLNIYGLNDELVPYRVSELFGEKCKNVTNYKHGGKHYVPTTKEMFDIMHNFIIKNIEK